MSSLNFASLDEVLPVQTHLKNYVQLFEETYPTLSFSDLTMQRMDCMTEDGCIHFYHNPTKQIYSWFDIKHKWIENGPKYQTSLLFLFDDKTTKK